MSTNRLKIVAGLEISARTPAIRLQALHVGFRYGNQQALTDVSMPLHAGSVTALIGPSGCGKSTLLRIFNRMHDFYRDQHADGQVLFDGQDILAAGADVAQVRRRIGMVFQALTTFPMSIYDNVAFGIRSYERIPKSELDGRVESALRSASLWEEVRDILKRGGDNLSGGQQQRLCIARAIAMEPDILLLDEPCSALDPISTARVEDTIMALKATCTVGIVTHNLQQAARISDYAAFMYLGRLVEFGTSGQIFNTPVQEDTQHFISGRFG